MTEKAKASKGRPPLEDSERAKLRSIRLTDVEYAELLRRGGAPALREWLRTPKNKLAETITTRVERTKGEVGFSARLLSETFGGFSGAEQWATEMGYTFRCAHPGAEGYSIIFIGNAI